MTAVRKRGKDALVLRWGRAKVVELFGADLRSLAAFRMVLALVVLADLAGRAPDLYAHYTDRGVLPRTILLQQVLNSGQISLNLMSGTLYFQALLFGVTALAALAMLVGYRTRLMTVIVWVLVVSIQARNPLVLNGGDVLLRLLLFWGMFLPLGAYWSVDRALEDGESAPRLSTRFLSLATVGLLLQIAFMYWFTAILKSGPEWRVDGSALYYVLSNGDWATPIGAYLYQFPTLLTALTFATILLEAFGPFLLFCPVFTVPVRTGAILAFMSLHYGIWLTMPIGIFSPLAAFCMVCFLPGWFWDKAWPALFPHRPNIVRRLQHAATHLLNTPWLPLRHTRLSSLASMGRTSMTGTADDGADQPQSHEAGKTPPAASPAKTPQGGGEIRPDAESTSEGEGEHRTEVEAEPRMLRSSLLTNVVALFFLLYVFCWNLTTVSEFAMPQTIRPLGHLLGLRQDWGVFAPGPRETSGWYVIPGTLRSGQQVNLMGAAIRNDFDPLREGVSWERPQDIASTLKNKYWRKYLSSLQSEDRADLRKYFGRYICREWNARHTGAEQLVELQIVYVKAKMLPDYQRTAPQKVVLQEHNCS